MHLIKIKNFLWDPTLHLTTLKIKESACGCAGIFNTINSIQVLAQVFENNNQLDKLEKFISINGALHYELPINKDMITLVRLDEPLCFREF